MGKALSICARRSKISQLVVEQEPPPRHHDADLPFDSIVVAKATSLPSGVADRCMRHAILIGGRG
jgi:hypothetical protein